MRDDLFVIIGEAGCGISELGAHLAQHPEILCHGYLFSPAAQGEFRGKLSGTGAEESGLEQASAMRDESQIAFLYKYALDAQGKRQVGFLISHEQFLSPRLAPTRESVRRDRDIKVIHVHRRNTLERLVFLKLKEQFAMERGQGKNEKVPRSIALTPKEVQIEFERTDARNAFVMKMLNEHQGLLVCYEDLQSNERTAVLHELQDFLSVTRIDIGNENLARSNHNPSELVENYDELAEWFRETQYESMFSG